MSSSILTLYHSFHMAQIDNKDYQYSLSIQKNRNASYPESRNFFVIKALTHSIVPGKASKRCRAGDSILIKQEISLQSNLNMFIS